MVQIIIVVTVVGAALYFAISQIVKRFKPGKKSNSCEGCVSDCALKCKH